MNTRTPKPIILRISSGRGPAECERAVMLFADWLTAELATLGCAVRILSRHPGLMPEGARSLELEISPDAPENAGRVITWLRPCVGTVQWICPSPYRRRHRRKNWFIQVALDSGEPPAGPAGDHPNRNAENPGPVFRPEEVRFETARSSGKGGQHVNKTETAVRAVHLPTGLSAVARDERSQLSNKKTALRRLEEVLAQRNRQARAERGAQLRRLHDRLERGNAALGFSGPDFKPIKHQTGKHD